MQSTAGDEASEYHLQAGIAACYRAAKENSRSSENPGSRLVPRGALGDRQAPPDL